MTRSVRLSTQGNWKQILLGLLFLAAFVALAGFLLWTLFRAFITLPPEIATAIIAGSATILVSVLTLVLSKQWERRLEIEQEHRKQKLPIYEEFMAFWFKVLLSHKPGMNPVSEEEMVEFFSTFTQKLIVWGSDEVLKEYSTFRRQSYVLAEQPSSAHLEPLLIFEQPLYAIRSDVGHKNRDLKLGDLLALFITDVDRVLEQAERSQDVSTVQ